MSNVVKGSTRRDFLKVSALGLSGVAAAGFLGCSSANSSEEGAEGGVGYIGRGTGAKGDVSALVVIEDGAITAVLPGDNIESWGPGESAFEIISEKVVETQSINVDTVSGATLTSMGYLTAIKEAVESAGMTEVFDVAVEEEVVEHEDVEYDAVIVGAGGAGLMAAMTLIYPGYDNVKSDLNVLVVEKLDITGGSTSLSYGGCAVGDGLQANDVMDYHVSAVEMTDLLYKRNSDGVNEPLAEAIFTKCADTVSSIAAFGGPYSTSYTGTVKTYSGYSYLQIDANLNILLSDVDKAELGMYSNQGGYQLANFLKTKVAQSGTEIRTGTEVVELLKDGDKACGVRVQEGSQEYEISAKNVILACGGFTQSADYMSELAGDMVPSYTPWCCAGATGDAFTLTESMDVTRVGEGALVYFSIDPQIGMFADLNNIYRQRKEIIVNEEGKRMADENEDEYYLAYNISQATNGHAFAVVDSENPNVATFEKWVERGKVVRADTIEELAELAGIDAAELAATIESYNTAYDNEESPEFGTPFEAMYPVKTGPFYAGEISICVIGSLVGLKVNESCQILDSTESPIEGLYGVGEVCLGGNILSMYYSGGCSIATALNTGRISAEHIAANL